MNKRIRKKVARRSAIRELIKESVENVIRDAAMDFSARIQVASMRGEIDLEQIWLDFQMGLTRMRSAKVCENGEERVD